MESWLGPLNMRSVQKEGSKRRERGIKKACVQVMFSLLTPDTLNTLSVPKVLQLNTNALNMF